jgi:hypothetical protein
MVKMGHDNVIVEFAQVLPDEIVEPYNIIMMKEYLDGCIRTDVLNKRVVQHLLVRVDPVK